MRWRMRAGADSHRGGISPWLNIVHRMFSGLRPRADESACGQRDEHTIHRIVDRGWVIAWSYYQLA